MQLRSTLLRTIRSVIMRSPASLLTEIILIDDHSTQRCIHPSPHCKSRIAALEPDIYEMEKVQYVRMAKREGLIRARMLGAEVAKGEVKCTLCGAAPHCNRCSSISTAIAKSTYSGWRLELLCSAHIIMRFQPLLQRIREDYANVVTPVIDVLDDEQFNVCTSTSHSPHTRCSICSRRWCAAHLTGSWCSAGSIHRTTRPAAAHQTQSKAPALLLNAIQ